MKSIGHIARLALTALVTAAALSAVAAPAIDTAIDKTVWQMLYGLTSAQVNDPAWLAQDSDGDGLTNADELAAGTNPLVATSTVRLTNLTADASNVALTFATVKGKLYTVQWTTTLGVPGSWAGFQPPVQVMGTGVAQIV